MGCGKVMIFQEYYPGYYSLSYADRKKFRPPPSAIIAFYGPPTYFWTRLHHSVRSWHPVPQGPDKR